MFKVGDKVVCIKEPESDKYLKYGEVYTISDCFDVANYSRQIIIFKEIPSVSFPCDRFKNNIEFRKDKIIKLKDRINITRRF